MVEKKKQKKTLNSICITLYLLWGLISDAIEFVHVTLFLLQICNLMLSALYSYFQLFCCCIYANVPTVIVFLFLSVALCCATHSSLPTTLYTFVCFSLSLSLSAFLLPSPSLHFLPQLLVGR